MKLPPGADLRLPQYRREVFLRFYTFHLRNRSHPGAVYYVLPWLAEACGWDVEQRAWAAFLNGNTQNPVTTWLLMQAGDRPARWREVVALWNAEYQHLEWDTDRRHHKSHFAKAVDSYLWLIEPEGTQERYWRRARTWADAWNHAVSIHSMGRLSAWSYLEYLRILCVGQVPDAADLMLHDRPGSRSHRNGLALVSGLDSLIWWDRNPTFHGNYTPEHITALEHEGASLLAEAYRRNPGNRDVGYLTLESALCTYKSWHRPRRRYPNVYNDLLYNRLVRAEARFGHQFDALWQARRDSLPPWLLLECTPLDPGVVPAKQNHYLLTGRPIMMERDWPELDNDFARQVARGDFGIRKDPRCPTS